MEYSMQSSFRLYMYSVLILIWSDQIKNKNKKLHVYDNIL